MVLQEELKGFPFGDVWDECCRICSNPEDGSWLEEIEKYDQKVLKKRG